jgi:hypothetical protein
VAEITGISKPVLSFGLEDMEACSVAERMSWAANRQTTKEEDIAYCLLGIFKVNMPLLYGEGSRAFIRLQEEILKRTEDYTLFLWASSIPKWITGLLAPSLSMFTRETPVIGSWEYPISYEDIKRYTLGR